MNKVFDVIINDIKKNRNIYLSLIIVLFISIIFGIIFITILSNNDKQLLLNSIEEYINTIKNVDYDVILLFKNNILNNNIYSIIIFVLGLSIIGIPIIICMLFYKGFTLSFTVTSILYHMKVKGILFSFIYIFPHLIINLILYFVLCCYSFNLSVNMYKLIFNKQEINMKTYLKKYTFVFILSIVLLSLTALYETYIIPYFIRVLN